MQILGLSGMYFDTALVFVIFTFIQVGSGHSVCGSISRNYKFLFSIFLVTATKYFANNQASS